VKSACRGDGDKKQGRQMADVKRRKWHEPSRAFMSAKEEDSPFLHLALPYGAMVVKEDVSWHCGDGEGGQAMI